MPAHESVIHDINGFINKFQFEKRLKSCYRVSVSLDRYFKDIRALSYVLVSRKKTVKWLEKKIQKLFNVQGSFVLTTRGHLLPPSERLGLLNADDIVEVIPHDKLTSTRCSNAQTVSSEVLDVDSDAITIDDCGSGNSQKKNIYSSKKTSAFGQKKSSKECEMAQISIPNNITSTLQSQIDCVHSGSINMLDVENDKTTIDECDSNAIKRGKYTSFEQTNSAKVFGSEHSVEDDISYNSNTQVLNEEADEVQDELEEMKRNALALIDKNFYTGTLETNTSNSNGSTRKRKRVRRKRQHISLSAEMPEKDYNEDNIANDIHINVTDTSNTLPLVAIVHNEEICARKPRIVQSIIKAP